MSVTSLKKELIVGMSILLSVGLSAGTLPVIEGTPSPNNTQNMLRLSHRTDSGSIGAQLSLGSQHEDRAHARILGVSNPHVSDESYLVFKTMTSTREWNQMTLDDQGQLWADKMYSRYGVFIGYPTPSETPSGYALAIRGKVYAEDFVTQTTVWADDVFEESYPLMSLEKLRQFVMLNKHLPGVPQESEVLGETVSLTDMQVILLRKIEELTLYVLALEADIEQLKNRK